jgi:hypothetical protein
MADVYIPNDVWSYIFTFIPLPKVEFNKVGFYLYKDKDMDENRAEIIQITKISKCFMWYSAYVVDNLSNISGSIILIEKETRKKKSNSIALSLNRPSAVIKTFFSSRLCIIFKKELNLLSKKELEKELNLLSKEEYETKYNKNYM